jgi:hypothetical protein
VRRRFPCLLLVLCAATARGRDAMLCSTQTAHEPSRRAIAPRTRARHLLPSRASSLGRL